MRKHALVIAIICASLASAAPLSARIMGAPYSEGAYACADHYWDWQEATRTWRGFFHQSFHTSGNWIKNYVYDFGFKYEGILLVPASFRIRWHALRNDAPEVGNDLELMLLYPWRGWQLAMIFNPHDLYLEGGDYVGWGLERQLGSHTLYLETGLSSGVETSDYSLYNPRPTTPIHTIYFKWTASVPERLGLSFEGEFNHVFKEYGHYFSPADLNLVEQQSNHAKWRLGGFMAGGGDGMRWLDNFHLANDLDLLDTTLYYLSPGHSEVNEQSVIWSEFRFYNNLHLLWDENDLYLRTANAVYSGSLRENRVYPYPTGYLPGLPGRNYHHLKYAPGYMKQLSERFALGAEIWFRYLEEGNRYTHSLLRAEARNGRLQHLIVETGHAREHIWFFKFTFLLEL